MIKVKNDFSTILESYFSKHLSLERKFSENTYKTYLIVLRQFIDYLVTVKDIKTKDISIYSFNKDNILDFLLYVEDVLNCSPKTRNHKLTVINSFLDYAQGVNPIYIDAYLQAKNIKFKREKKQKRDFLTKEELEIFMNCINIKSKSGYKHYIMIALLYESGARVSELVNLTVSNLFLIGESPYIKILGKGNKERIVYINNDVVTMINEYMAKFKIENRWLFLNNSGDKFSRFGINKLIEKYVEISKKECPTLVNKTISPHSFRHSKAVHMLLNNTAIPIIQRFLGHASITTTEIYLDITNDEVIKSVKSIASLINTSDDEKKLWENDDKLIELLESLNK